MTLGYYARLEPRTRSDDLTPGIAARVYDAAWLLARQWQLGELNGDDGGTPIAVRHTGVAYPCTSYRDAGGTRPLDPGQGPLEAFAQPGPSVLTRRHRVDLGRALLRRLRAGGLADRIAALLTNFPLSSGLAAGRIPDGAAVLAAFGDSLRSEPPSLPPVPGLVGDAALVQSCVSWLPDCDAILGEPSSAAWNEKRVGYEFSVDVPGATGGVRLVADDYRGGPLDWWAFDAATTDPDPAAVGVAVDSSTIPTRAVFRGMPAPRWWQEENAVVDLGVVEANVTDLARMAMLQFALVFGNDHFVLPVPMTVGTVMRTTNLLVSDTFGATLAVDPSGFDGQAGRRGEGSSRWSMFCPTLADGTGVADVFVLPASAMHTLTGRPLEEVHLLRDEMANLAWAVETLVEGGEGPVRPAQRPRPAQPSPPEIGPLRYRLGNSVPPNWFPLVPVRNANGDVPELVVQPMADSGEVPAGSLVRLGLVIDDDRMPHEGRRLLRESVITRWTDGTVLTWTRRRATTGRGPGSSGLSFDDALPGTDGDS